MTGQRIYAFIVNGEFWQKQEVDEKIIRQGEIFIPVAQKLSIAAMTNYSKCCNTCVNMKKVRFQLVETAERRGYFEAHWFEAFWLSDKDIYLEDGCLYLKEKKELKTKHKLLTKLEIEMRKFVPDFVQYEYYPRLWTKKVPKIRNTGF